ncbi:MAG: type III pantothenate kinase [Prevotellaceae bacterium]|jgi:type III pantothenate kinase|nr:type III pantothenate kinase [Prevotellaceae bacterium]
MINKLTHSDYSLILDIGNSAIKLFVVSDFEILYSATYSNIADLEKIFTLFPGIKNGICSASGRIPCELESFLAERLENFVNFSPDTPIPITNLYRSPETLGSDRLAAAIGVNHFFPDTNVMIFDFGTAITIDFIDSGNNYLGGNISPGLSMRFKSLNFFTNRLPLLQIPDKIEEIGTTTNEAIEIGVVRGIIGETMNYISKYPEHKIIFTGGDSFYFAVKIKTPIFVFQNPLVFGLNRILNRIYF